jgi:hypothetical protein
VLIVGGTAGGNAVATAESVRRVAGQRRHVLPEARADGGNACVVDRGTAEFQRGPDGSNRARADGLMLLTGGSAKADGEQSRREQRSLRLRDGRDRLRD